MIRVLLDHGADVQSKPWGGDSPFYLAVSLGNQEVLKLFLKHTESLPTQRRENVLQGVIKVAEDRGNKVGLKNLEKAMSSQ